jgi:hypothetical protein
MKLQGTFFLACPLHYFRRRWTSIGLRLKFVWKRKFDDILNGLQIDEITEGWTAWLIGK